MSREAVPANHEVGVLQVYKIKSTASTVPLLFQVVVKKNTPPLFLKYEDFKRNYPQILINYLETKFNIISSSQKLAGNQIWTRSRRDNSAIQRQKILKQLQSQSKESKMIDEGQPQPQAKQSQENDSMSISYQSSTQVNIDGIMQSQRSMRKIPDMPKYQLRHYSPPKSKKRLILDPEMVRQQQQKKKAAIKQAKKEAVVAGPKILDYQQIMRDKYGQDYAIYYDYAIFSKDKNIFKAPKGKKYQPPKKAVSKAKQKRQKDSPGNQQWEKEQPKTESNRARRYANRK